MKRNLIQESLDYLLSLPQDLSEPDNIYKILKDPKQKDKLFQVIDIIDPKRVKDITKDIYFQDFRNKKNRKVIEGTSEIYYENVHLLVNWGCSKDINYFSKFFRIVNIDDGLIEIPLRDWQRESLQDFISYPFHILNCSRQVGKSTSVSLYASWKFLYRPFNNAAILANKYRSAKLLLHRIKIGYEHLPFYLQQPMTTYNVNELVGLNGSRIFATATTEDSISGEAVNDLIIDEVSKIISSKFSVFWDATLPVISSAKRKSSISVILLSTPLGDNHWKPLVENARLGEGNKNWNKFKLKEITYRDIPERNTEEWREEQIAQNGLEWFMQEHEAKFVTQKDIYFTSTVLDAIITKRTIKDSHIQSKFKDYTDNISIYEKPQLNHVYAISFDPSEMKKDSKKNEHTNFGIQIVDVTDMRQKWRQVLSVNFEEDFDYLESPMLLVFLAKYYNNGWIIGENNKCKQILNDIKRDYQYENIFKEKDDWGYRTTTGNKSIHAKLLKILLDRQILEINDEDTLFELKKFSKMLKAQSGYSDGLVLSMMGIAMLLTLNEDKIEAMFGSLEEGIFIKRGKDLLQLSAGVYENSGNDITGVIFEMTDEEDKVQEILENSGFKFKNYQNTEDDEDFFIIT